MFGTPPDPQSDDAPSISPYRSPTLTPPTPGQRPLTPTQPATQVTENPYPCCASQIMDVKSPSPPPVGLILPSSSPIGGNSDSEDPIPIPKHQVSRDWTINTLIWPNCQQRSVITRVKASIDLSDVEWLSSDTEKREGILIKYYDNKSSMFCVLQLQFLLTVLIW